MADTLDKLVLRPVIRIFDMYAIMVHIPIMQVLIQTDQ